MRLITPTARRSVRHGSRSAERTEIAAEGAEWQNGRRKRQPPNLTHYHPPNNCSGRVSLAHTSPDALTLSVVSCAALGSAFAPSLDFRGVLALRLYGQRRAARQICVACTPQKMALARYVVCRWCEQIRRWASARRRSLCWSSFFKAPQRRFISFTLASLKTKKRLPAV